MQFPADLLMWIGRACLAMLFAAGAVQKMVDPSAAGGLLVAWSLPAWLVWPAAVANAAGAMALLFGLWLSPVALALAIYCMVTSLFHFIPSDPWQMSIFVKNWAISGGLLCLSAHESIRHPKDPPASG